MYTALQTAMSHLSGMGLTVNSNSSWVGFRACLFHLLLGGCWGTAASFVCGPIGYWFTCVPCYAAQYRRRLRQKQGLPEMPYSDFTTHFLCHPFAVCQEHREINLKQSQSVPGPGGSTIDRGPDETVTHVEAVQKMER
ncbi:cell number regulator 5 isoform X3 [Cryptomeria japonica]|uniref:cell number regulator 5 isoform X3 n=1 Tax=Cryptomeria japonica TaxID=3369 RepID=UPI0027DAABA5|nr:cell number regulator 5 isoform X3 [Cryptomeria japonica]